jgi:hypothetical protein
VDYPRSAEAPYILVIAAPERRVTGLWSSERFLVWCYYQSGAFSSHVGSRLALRMISFSSLVALVISCSSAATS